MNVVTERQFNSCINGDVFNYFNELRHLDSDLKQKLYREDNKATYEMFVDSLEKLKSLYKTSYEYIYVNYSNLSGYNVDTKEFSHDQQFNSFKNEDDIYKVLKSIRNENQSFSSFTFYPIKDVVQRASISDFIELYGVKVYKGHIKTEIKIHNERDALQVENAKALSVLILFNRFESSNGIHKPRKVLFFVGDEIIQSYGEDKIIDELIKSPIPYSFKTEITAANPFGEVRGFGEDKGRDIPNKNMKEKNSLSEGTTVMVGGRIRLSNITSKPKTHNAEPCTIALKLTVDSHGNVVRADIYRSGTTATNQRLIEEVIGLVKKEVHYKKKPGAGHEIVYYTVSIEPR